MQDNENFAQRLKELRKKAGINQEELADILNVSIKTVQRWEWGQHTPRVEDIQKICKALNVSEADLLNPHAQDNKSWVLQIKIADDITQEVIDMARNVPTVSSITTTPAGGFICLGGDYSLWTDDNSFKKILADLKKFRNTVIQNGKALGGIKE